MEKITGADCQSCDTHDWIHVIDEMCTHMSLQIYEPTLNHIKKLKLHNDNYLSASLKNI